MWLSLNNNGEYFDFANYISSNNFDDIIKYVKYLKSLEGVNGWISDTFVLIIFHQNLPNNELHMNKTQLAKEIGVSGQFLGLVEDGKGNLVYKSIKKLRALSGHSADYILYGLDDNTIKETKQYLKEYNEEELINALQILKEITKIMKK